MIGIAQVLRIHQRLIESYGGSHGVRDENLLISSISRPFSGFGENEFYASIEEKAAAIFESIVKNHPFIDGNKRTGYYVLEAILFQENKVVFASEDQKYDFVIQVASGKLDFNAILDWIKSNSRLQ